MDDFKTLEDIIVKINNKYNRSLLDDEDVENVNDDMESFEEDYARLKNNLKKYENLSKEDSLYNYPSYEIRTNILYLTHDYECLFNLLDRIAINLRD